MQLCTTRLTQGPTVVEPLSPSSTSLVHAIQVPGQEQSNTTTTTNTTNTTNMPEQPKIQSEDTQELLDDTTLQVVDEFFTSD